MKRVYKCEYCYLQNARPCYECSACMSGDDHFRPVKPEKKQMTNADKIRAMNDDELADLINREISYCAPTGDCEKTSNDCKACWLDWLQQPAEVDHA